MNLSGIENSTTLSHISGHVTLALLMEAKQQKSEKLELQKKVKKCVNYS